MKYKITEIHKIDSYFPSRKEYIGEVFEGEIKRPQFFQGYERFQAGKQFFLAVKLEEVKQCN